MTLLVTAHTFCAVTCDTYGSDVELIQKNRSASWYLTDDPECAVAPSEPGLYIFIKHPEKSFQYPHMPMATLGFIKPLIKVVYVPAQGQKQEVLIKGGAVQKAVEPYPIMVRVFAKVSESFAISSDIFSSRIPYRAFSHIIGDNKVICEDKPPFRQTFAYPLPYNTKLPGEKPYIEITTSDRNSLKISMHAQDRDPDTFYFFESSVSASDL